MKLALLGGTFSPFHIGHAMLAETAVKELGYDKVLIVPAYIPPHKQMNAVVSAEDRLGMVRAFCRGTDCFEAEDCEIARGGISYTIDTLLYEINKYGGKLEGKPGFIMGQETAAEFGKWRRAEDIAQTADIIIARRHPDANSVDTSSFENRPVGAYTGGFVPDSAIDAFPYHHLVLENPMLPVSSTEIRARIATGKSWRYLVPESVFQYIIERKLYEYK